MRRYVGERIKKLREAQDMSLEQVCRMTGIATDRLRAYEEGTAVPPIGTVIQLSRVLGSKACCTGAAPFPRPSPSAVPGNPSVANRATRSRAMPTSPSPDQAPPAT